MYIYKTTNIINGKIYIGQHKNKDKSYLGSGKLLKRAIKLYGKENFVVEILEEDIEDLFVLNLREQYWIDLYKSMDKNIGYNIDNGGKMGSGQWRTGKSWEEIYGEDLAQKTKDKISKIQKGRTIPQEQRDKISKSLSGENHPNWGKKFSEETKEKMSKARSGMPRKDISLRNQGRKLKNSSSKYSGVRKDEKSTNRPWRAKIKKDGISYELGNFKTENEAGEAYNQKALELFGESAKLNNIDYSVEEISPTIIERRQGVKIKKNTSSKYVGVSWKKKNSAWASSIRYNKKTIWIGLFDTELEAALAYNQKAIELYGPNAKINIIEENLNND